MAFRTTILLIVSFSAFAQQSADDRLQAYWRSLVSPMGGITAVVSSGIRQAANSPEEWKGASGFGYRMADVYGKRFTRATLEFGLASALHEDNRFRPSGESGFWPRTLAAVRGTFMARHDDGSEGISVSRLAGTAGASFIARSWQPPSTRSAGDAVAGFGIGMSIETGIHVFREFWPDIKKRIHDQ